MATPQARDATRPPFLAAALVGLPGAFTLFLVPTYVGMFARAWRGRDPDQLFRTEVYLALAIAFVAVSLSAAFGVARRRAWGSILGGLLALSGLPLGGLILLGAAVAAGFGGDASDVAMIAGVGLALVGLALLALTLLIRGRHGLAPLRKPSRRSVLAAIGLIALALAVHVAIAVQAAAMP